MRTKALKRFCDGPPEYGLNVPASEYTDAGYRFLRTSDIGEGGTLRDQAGVFIDPAELEPRHELVEGDLLFSRAGTLGRCLRYETSMGKATYAGYLVRFRPDSSTDPRFLAYCSQGSFFQEAIQADAVTSTISNFNAEKYAELRIPDTPLQSQRAIADYLDAETARIDDLIAKKQQLIHLLEERELAAIELAIAGCAVRFTSLKRSASFFTDGDWIESPFITEDGIRLIQTGNVGRGEFKDQGDRYISSETFRQLRCTEVLPGDVLISRLANTVGQGCIAPDLGKRMVTSVDVVILRPSDSFDAQFLVEWLSTPRHLAKARLEARGTTMQRLARSQVGELPVPVLPLGRQRLLASESVERRRAHDRAVTPLRRQIELLAERRQALITAAVAGEFTVPGAA